VIADDVKCFDQFCNPKTFVQSVQNDEEFKSTSASDKRVEHFQKDCNGDCHSGLLKIAEFFFCIPSLNADLERIFFLDVAQRTGEQTVLPLKLQRMLSDCSTIYVIIPAFNSTNIS
jgi:hypothetical protein